MTSVQPQISILGLGRMGTAVAARLRQHYEVQTWTRSLGGSPLAAIKNARFVLLCLYDGAACRDVLDACSTALGPGTTVVNTSTVGPAESSILEAQVLRQGAAYLHAPVIGSTPAVARGGLTILSGGEPSPELAEVLATLGEVLELENSIQAAGLKLVANGVLGDSVAALGRSLRRAQALGLPRPTVLAVLERTVLGPIVQAKRHVLDPRETSAGPSQFSAGALRKDLDLLAEAIGTTTGAGDDAATLLDSRVLRCEDDMARLAVTRTDESRLDDARLTISPEVIADPAALRPLHSYALAHASGDPRHLDEAFLPTAHIEGFRDGAFVSWDLRAFRGRFPGHPAADEESRTRRVERLDIRGDVATASMTLRHGPDLFTDVFVLVRDPAARWWIANKAYHRLPATSRVPARGQGLSSTPA